MIMDISSAQYIQDQTGTNTIVKTVIDSVTMYVPIDTDNRHYAAILEWVAEGNTIQEAD